MTMPRLPHAAERLHPSQVGIYTPAPTASSRFTSIDILRGAVMVLMAIDHVRVYAGVPAGGPDPAVFLTRWVTHFCAPLFFFLAGTSAFLYGRTHRDLPRFLATRGVWLVFLELTVLRVAWTFNLDFRGYMLAGVIWALGWSMVALAAMVRLPVKVVAAIGIAIIAGHNLLDGVVIGGAPGWQGSVGALWKILYVGFFAGPIQVTPAGPSLTVLYSLLPWIGVMAAGFGFGAVMTLDERRRRTLCLAIGLGATGLFVALRAFNLYGDPGGWQRGGPMPALLAFLNTTKYPASLQFLLMTLGPGIALIPFLEGAKGRIARVLTTFGRVPFFFYLLHIPLIHAMALVVSLVRTGAVTPWLFENHSMGNGPAPAGYRWSLPLLYLVWAIAVALLYFACRWYASVKATGRHRGLRYL